MPYQSQSRPFCQNRHVMCNPGYLNTVLRHLVPEESDRYAYHEKDE